MLEASLEVIATGDLIGILDIGAGSVLTKKIPPDIFAAGNPCRVICRLNH